MLRTFSYLLAGLLLAGCQTAAPLAELDYNTQQDFSHWHSWQWADPAVEFYSPEQTSDLDASRIRDVVGEQLTQWGYLPKDKPDFLVRAWLGQEERVERVYMQRGGYWGPYYWGGPGWLDSHNVRYRVFTLRLDFLDAKTGKLAWRASDQWPATSSTTKPEQRNEEIRKAARRLLQSFPPH